MYDNRIVYVGGASSIEAANLRIGSVSNQSKIKVLVSSVIGSVIEWYDYTVDEVAAALVFKDLFFSNFSSAVGTVTAFGTFAPGFVARSLGGIFAGHMGDRIGRKSILVMTLITMGLATTAIGLLPTYSQEKPHPALGLW